MSDDLKAPYPFELRYPHHVMQRADDLRTVWHHAWFLASLLMRAYIGFQLVEQGHASVMANLSDTDDIHPDQIEQARRVAARMHAESEAVDGFMSELGFRPSPRVGATRAESAAWEEARDLAQRMRDRQIWRDGRLPAAVFKEQVDLGFCIFATAAHMAIEVGDAMKQRVYDVGGLESYVSEIKEAVKTLRRDFPMAESVRDTCAHFDERIIGEIKGKPMTPPVPTDVPTPTAGYTRFQMGGGFRQVTTPDEMEVPTAAGMKAITVNAETMRTLQGDIQALIDALPWETERSMPGWEPGRR